MKTITLAFSILFLIISRAAAQEPLLDSDGDEVVAGAEYYMVQIVRNAEGGGINVIAGRNGPCPFDLYLLDPNTYQGRSLSFYPANNATKVVTTSTDVNIKFNLPFNACPNDFPAWKVDNYDPNVGYWFLTTGGTVGNPGPQTLMNWFKFERIGDGYKLVHCPSVCPACGNLCLNVSYIPLNFRFKLALLPPNYFYPRFELVKVSSLSKIKQLVHA